MVWDRASEDTTGLRMFYEKNKARYKWDERALIYYVSIDTSDMKLANKIYKFMAKKSISKGIDKFDKKKILLPSKKYYREEKYRIL